MRTGKLLWSLPALALTFVVLSGMTACSDDPEKSPAERYTVDADAEEIEFPADGGTIPLVFSTNAAWQLHSSSQVMSYTPSSGDGPAQQQTVMITMPALASDAYTDLVTSLTIRTGELETDRVKREIIMIVQKGRERLDREPGIWTPEDWNNFAAIYNVEGDFSQWQDENGVINLRADLNFGATKITGVGGQGTGNAGTGAELAFSDHFDGNDFTITGQLDDGNRKVIGVFNRLAPMGRIENLKVNVTGVSTWTGSDGHLAGVVAYSCTVGATGGYIKNCVADGTLTHAAPASTKTRVGAIAAYCRTHVYECVNNMTIVAASNRVGGISGGLGQAVTIKDCVNNGSITVNVSSDSPQVGGIGGQVNGQMIIGCVNNGTITVTAENAVYVGGIGGQAQGSAVIGGTDAGEGNVNNGTILLKYDETVSVGTPAAGGIIGHVNANVPVTNCVNNAAVTSDVPADVSTTIMTGGIVGRLNNTAAILGCTNAATATVKAGHNTGGIVGMATSGSGTISGCSNLGTVDAVDRATAGFIGGIIGNKGSVTYTDCTYGGTVMGEAGSAANAEGAAAP